MSSDKKIVKEAVKRVTAKKLFWRHFLVFVMGNFILFFMSLSSWTPAIFFLLTLVWMRLLATHFKNAYPEVINDFAISFHEGAEDQAIDKEIKKLEAEEALPEADRLILKKTSPKFTLKALISKQYEDTDLV